MVIVIIPFIVSVFDFSVTLFSITFRLINWKIEELSKALKEDAEQEITIDFSLNMRGKLLYQLLIWLVRNSLVFVIDPSVVKVFFNLIFHLNWERSSVVEPFDQT